MKHAHLRADGQRQRWELLFSFLFFSFFFFFFSSNTRSQYHRLLKVPRTQFFFFSFFFSSLSLSLSSFYSSCSARNRIKSTYIHCIEQLHLKATKRFTDYIALIRSLKTLRRSTHRGGKSRFYTRIEHVFCEADTSLADTSLGAGLHVNKCMHVVVLRLLMCHFNTENANQISF